MASYDNGAVVRASVTFTVAGSVTDPTTVSLIVRTPAGVITTYTYAGATVSKTSTGLYYKDLAAATVAGTYTYHWAGTGACAATDDGEFFANPSLVD